MTVVERDGSVRDMAVPGPHGSVPVRCYEASGAPAGAPGLVWVHGGAFAYGDLDMPEADWVARQLAARGVVVVSVDYRLAPAVDLGAEAGAAAPPATGACFPVPSDDVLAAFTWTHKHATDLGIDPRRLSVGGASAGADLAAGASLRLRDGGGPRPHSVLLAYPIVHAVLPAASAELAAKLDGLRADERFAPETVAAMNLNYAGEQAVLANPYAFPGGHDLAGLPPTFILNSDVDSLRASGERYATELEAAGVPVIVLREEGTRHGHLNEPDQPAALASIGRMSAWLHDETLDLTAVTKS